MNKKGFTLKGAIILAVFIIVAGYATMTLISTQLTLGVVDEAKQGVIKSYALGYVRKIEKEIALNSLKDVPLVFPANQELNILESPIDDLKIGLSSKPSKGFVTLSESGAVKTGTFCIDNVKVIYDDGVSTLMGKCN